LRDIGRQTLVRVAAEAAGWRSVRQLATLPNGEVRPLVEKSLTTLDGCPA
jgi:hypothetical protein